MKSVQWIIRKCGKGDRIVKYEFQVCDSLRLGLLFLDLHFVVEVPPGQHIPRGLHRSNDLAKVRMYPDHLELIKMKIVWKKLELLCPYFDANGFRMWGILVCQCSIPDHERSKRCTDLWKHVYKPASVKPIPRNLSSLCIDRRSWHRSLPRHSKSRKWHPVLPLHFLECWLELWRKNEIENSVHDRF